MASVHYWDILADRAARFPERPAFTMLAGDGHTVQSIKMGELELLARRLSLQIAEHTRPGERALILAPISIAYVAGVLACLHAGVVAVPAYPPHQRRGDRRIDGILRDATPQAVLTTTAAAVKLREGPGAAAWPSDLTWIDIESPGADRPLASPEPRFADSRGLALIQYTSGSTREPRGVRLTQNNICHNAEQIVKRLGAAPGDVLVSWAPLFHDMGLIGSVFSAIWSVCHIHLMRAADVVARPASWLEAMSKLRATLSMAPNFGYDLCLRRIPDDIIAALDLSSWRVALNGAETVRAGTIEAFSNRFAGAGFRRHAFLPAYGLAECTLMVSGGGAVARSRLIPDVSSASEPQVSCGQVIEDMEVRIVDPERRAEALPGETGELWIRGPSVADGYWNRHAESAEVFSARLDGDATPFLRTGDLGYFDDGELVIASRLKDVIVIRGANIYPQDVEIAVEKCHPALAGPVAVVSAPIGGEERLVVIAEVNRQSAVHGIDGQELLISIRDAIGRVVAAEVGGVALVRPLSIPRTSSGKIRRSACREAWSNGSLSHIWRWTLVSSEYTGQQTGSDAIVGDGIVEAIKGAVAQQLQMINSALLPIDSPLSGLGLDSLGLVAVRASVETSLKRTISIDTIADDPTIAEFASRLGAESSAAVFGQKTDLSALDPEVRVALSLMFFSADAGMENGTERDVAPYDFVLEACRIADSSGFESVWFPERHFHRFGGLFPNPSVLGAAAAAVTRRLRIRAGSIVLPLHDPVCVREEWAVVDQLSGGRVDLAFASGWDANSYSLRPEAYDRRKELLLEGVDEFIRLWRGGGARRRNGYADEVEISPFPPVRQPMPGIWLTVAHDAELFAYAGRRGLNVLTALLFQSPESLASKIRVYRESRAAAGFEAAAGRVTLMLHTFIGTDDDRVREIVRPSLMRYLDSSVDLWKQESPDLSSLTPGDREAVLTVAFERYYNDSGLFGTVHHAKAMLARVGAIGIDEVACLVDFGVPAANALASIRLLSHVMPTVPLSHAAAIVKSIAATPGGDDSGIDMGLRRQPPPQKTRDIFARPVAYPLFDQIRHAGLMCFYQEFGERKGACIRCGDRWLLQLGSLDYLGLAIDERVRVAAARAAVEQGTSRTGSRLHNGSTSQQRAFEQQIAAFLGREDALVFATGYQAQVGLISGLADADTLVVLDEHAHASLYDGALIARCRIVRFRHNDAGDLDRVLSRPRPDVPVLVAVEGLYSNEGDLAALPDIVDVCARHGVRLALDEAHGLGVLGATGRGTEEEFGICGRVDILSGTFSKSLASVGGWIAGPAKVIDWIRFHGRSILFSAAIPPASLAAAAAALDILKQEPWRVKRIRELAVQWRERLRTLGMVIGSPRGPIVPIYLGEDLGCLRAARELTGRDIYVNAVLPPSVPVGKALLRTCVTAAHDWEQLEHAAGVIAGVVASSRVAGKRGGAAS